jgi:UDP-perosamine 4-acetyltransferase
MKYKLLVLGTGWLARDVAELIEDFPQYEFAGFVNNQPPFEHGSQIDGKPIFWIDELEDFDASYRAVCGLANMKKVGIIQQVKDFGIPFVNLVHPLAHISRSVTLGEGVIIFNGVHISGKTVIGSHVYIDQCAIISHAVMVGDYSFISSGANISCHVDIQPKAYIGLGAIVLRHTTIGALSVVGAGSLVSKDVPDKVKVFGMPAVAVEKDIEGF